MTDGELTEYIKEFNKTLKNIRQSMNIKENDITQKTGLSRNIISKIESETGNPTLTQLIKYCECIDVNLFDVLMSHKYFNSHIYTKEGNLKRIDDLENNFMGGENEDTPINPTAYEHMRYIVNQCDQSGIPQPGIFPWSGGIGIQAEWEYDYYLEIDSKGDTIYILIVEGNDYKNSISTRVSDIESAFKIIKVYIRNIVNINGKRRTNKE